MIYEIGKCEDCNDVTLLKETTVIETVAIEYSYNIIYKFPFGISQKVYKSFCQKCLNK